MSIQDPPFGYGELRKRLVARLKSLGFNTPAGQEASELPANQQDKSAVFAVTGGSASGEDMRGGRNQYEIIRDVAVTVTRVPGDASPARAAAAVEALHEDVDNLIAGLLVAEWYRNSGIVRIEFASYTINPLVEERRTSWSAVLSFKVYHRINLNRE